MLEPLRDETSLWRRICGSCECTIQISYDAMVDDWMGGDRRSCGILLLLFLQNCENAQPHSQYLDNHYNYNELMNQNANNGTAHR